MAISSIPSICFRRLIRSGTSSLAVARSSYTRTFFTPSDANNLVSLSNSSNERMFSAGKMDSLPQKFSSGIISTSKVTAICY